MNTPTLRARVYVPHIAAVASGRVTPRRRAAAPAPPSRLHRARRPGAPPGAGSDQRARAAAADPGRARTVATGASARVGQLSRDDHRGVDAVRPQRPRRPENEQRPARDRASGAPGRRAVRRNRVAVPGIAPGRCKPPWAVRVTHPGRGFGFLRLRLPARFGRFSSRRDAPCCRCSAQPLAPPPVTALAFCDFVNAPDSESNQLAVRARAWAERTRRQQGLPVKISDPRMIERVAAILRDARAKTPQT